MSNCLMNSVISRLCALAIGLALIAGCSPNATGESGSASTASADIVRSTGSSFSAEELKKILQRQNASALSESLNKVKKLGATRDGLQLLEQVWAGNQSQHPDLAWQTIADPEVRLNLADILVQAARNGEIESEPADAHQFALDVVNTQPPKLVNQALTMLSIFERDEDVAVIEKVALRHDQRTFRSAVAALSSMCAPAARAALDRIEQGASSSEKEFITDTRTRLSDYRQRAGGCAPR
jgi:hypothetical protein